MAFLIDENESLFISHRSLTLEVKDSITIENKLEFLPCCEIEHKDAEKAAVDGIYKVCKVRHYAKINADEIECCHPVTFDEHEIFYCSGDEAVIKLGCYYLVYHESCDPERLARHILKCESSCDATASCHHGSEEGLVLKSGSNSIAIKDPMLVPGTNESQMIISFQLRIPESDRGFAFIFLEENYSVGWTKTGSLEVEMNEFR